MPDWIHMVTVDASYDKASRVTGVGVVIQERIGASGRGPILERVAEAHTGVAPGTGELFAVLNALESRWTGVFTRIKIRSDYNAMGVICVSVTVHARQPTMNSRTGCWNLPAGSSGSTLATCHDEKIRLRMLLPEMVAF